MGAVLLMCSFRETSCLLWSLETHMEKCGFIGYPSGYKGSRFYSPGSKKMMMSERADLDEHYFMLQSHSEPHLPPPRPDTLLETPPTSTHCLTFWMACWTLQKLHRSQFMGELVQLSLICLLLHQFCLQSLQIHSNQTPPSTYHSIHLLWTLQVNSFILLHMTVSKYM